jgi:transposase InsO family protein
MSQESGKNEDERALLLALFRYEAIAPVVEAAELARGQTQSLIRSIVERTYYFPGKGPVSVAERTAWEWIRRYRQEGLQGLLPQIRSDKGKPRVLAPELLDRAIGLRKENPDRWTRTLIDIMKREGSFQGKKVPHRSTLDRHLARCGMSRRQMKVLGEKRTIKMQFENFGDLWVGDYHHGPLILAPNGKPTTAKLGAFIDHCTRYPVADRYYLAENMASLRDCLYRALLKWGHAKKAYVDRGSVYRWEQLAYSLDRIDTKLVHSRAYYSQGRGVIEKWWQVAGAFESEVGIREELLTLHELNRLWEAYRELRYCQEMHSELKMTPNEAVAGVIPRPLDPEALRELFLVRADRTVHKKDACVAVESIRYLCDSSLRGQKVQVRFDPNELSSVLIFRDGKRLQKAFPQVPNEKPQPHPEPAKPPAQSVDYLSLLRQDYDRKLLEHARPLAYCTLEPDATFGPDQFICVVTQLAGITPRRSDKEELKAFWETFGSLPEEIVRIGTEHAVRLHGRGRHVRVYLHAVRTLVLAQWQSPPEQGGIRP